MKKRILKRYSAFTIMEVSIVMIVIGIVVALVFSSIVGFQKQLKKETEIKFHLSKWHIFRTNLYLEFYLSKKTEVGKDSIHIQTDLQKVSYYLEENKLMRITNNISQETGFEVSEWSENEIDGISFVTLNFLWENEIMSLTFPETTDNAQRVNDWFNKYKSE